MKTILIPIDFSETSIKALEVAANIAKRVNAKLILTHMSGVEDGLSKAPNDFEEAVYYSKLIGKKFEELINKPFLSNVLVEPMLQKHLNFESVSDLATELSSSLIVMGSRGSKGLAEFFVGSNTEKVVRTSETPVLVIKNNDLQFAPERILYASDFDLESLTAYHRIIEVSKMLKARIEFLYVNTPGNNFKSTNEVDEVLLDFFKAAKHSDPVKAIKTVNRFSDYTVEEGIMNFASISSTDIIAIPTHGRKGWAHILQGSISEDVANHSLMPVLTVKM